MSGSAGFATMPTGTSLGTATRRTATLATLAHVTGTAGTTTTGRTKLRTGFAAMPTGTSLRATGLALISAGTSMGRFGVIATGLTARTTVGKSTATVMATVSMTTVTAIAFPGFTHAFKTFPYALNHILTFPIAHLVPFLLHAVQSLPHGGTP